MKSWTVYKHISPSEKVYIGISSNVKNRWAANGYYYHLSDTAFSRALKKYGWDNFQHIIIAEGLTKNEACDMEIELIAYYKAKGTSYNITDGGLGYSGKHSAKQVRNRINSRISNSTQDYLVIDKDFNYIICQTEKEAAAYLEGTQRNISHVLGQPIGYTFRKHYVFKHKKGTPVDINSIKNQIEEALFLRKKKQSELAKKNKDKMVAASRKERESLSTAELKERYQHEHKKGWKHSEETKKKMSLKAKGRDMSKAIEASKEANMVPVVQMLNGMIINEFTSIKEASKFTNINMSNIGNCAKGRRKTAGGFTWKYKKEMEEQYVDK